MGEFPIKLRQEIVNPSFFFPQKNIGIESVVILQSAGVATARIRGFVTPDTEWAHTEAHPRFGCFNAFMQVFYEQVYVMPAPIVAFHSFAIFAVRGVIGESFAFDRIRIEIIVEMNSVNVVSF